MITDPDSPEWREHAIRKFMAAVEGGFHWCFACRQTVEVKDCNGIGQVVCARCGSPKTKYYPGTQSDEDSRPGGFDRRKAVTDQS